METSKQCLLQKLFDEMTNRIVLKNCPKKVHFSC